MRSQKEAQYTLYELAKISFKECLDFIDLYARFKDTFAEQDLRTFARAISKSVVITYAKPFTNNDSVNGFGVGHITDKFYTSLSEQDKKLHDFLVKDARGTFVAHMDLGKLMPNIWIKEGGQNDIAFTDNIPIFSTEQAPDYIKLFQTAHDYCVSHQCKIKPLLKTDHIIPSKIKPEIDDLLGVLFYVSKANRNFTQAKKDIITNFFKPIVDALSIKDNIQGLESSKSARNFDQYCKHVDRLVFKDDDFKRLVMQTAQNIVDTQKQVTVEEQKALDYMMGRFNISVN